MDGEEQVFIRGRVARRGVPMVRAENIWSYGGTCVLRIVCNEYYARKQEHIPALGVG